MPLNFVAKAAITVALTAANMALTMSRKIEGPRLDDLKATGADYGTPLYMLWGMRRLEVPIFWAEELREVKRRRKTKGGKFNEYTYYGTWAVAVAGHEIAAIRRIWFDTHLIYDVSGAGPVTPFDFGTTGDISDAISIYLGTETQEPDPRMQATVEAAQGADSCPAYRGTAYIVFKDIPLEKLGNRIPQVSVEAISTVNSNYPFESFTINDTNLSRLWGATFSTDYSRFMWSSQTYYEIWDVAARARIIAGSITPNILFQGPLGMYNDGTFLAVSAVGGDILRFEADGRSGALFYSPSFTAGGVRVLADSAGNEHWIALSSTYLETEFAVDGTEYDFTTWFPSSWPSWAFSDSEGSIWIAGSQNGALSTTVHFLRLITGADATGPSTLTVTGLNSLGVLGPSGHEVIALHYKDATLDQFVFTFNDHVYAVDRLTGAVLQDNASLVIDPYNADNQFAAVAPGASSMWFGTLNVKEVSLADLSVIRTVNMNNWTTEAADGVIYDAVNHALITSPTSTPKITWRYLDRVNGAGVTLSSVAGDVADYVGVEDYDFSNLDQSITGWSATRGQASNMIEPLLDAYDSDIRPHDWQIQGIKRTGVASGTTLATNKFVGSPRYTVGIKQAAELPKSITIDYADVAADQQPNSARVSRPLDATDAKGEQKLDLTTLVLTASEAIQLAGRYFRRLWNERKQPAFGVTAQNLALEPGDVRTIDLDGETITARATRVLVKADDSIETEWRYDSATLATLDGSAGAEFDGRLPSEISIPLLSKGFVLDVPYLNDLDDVATPLVYVAAGPYADGTWPGATFFEETGGEYTDEFASVPSTSPVTWGFVSELMPDANPNVWDRGTELTVTLQTGELTGCTEAQALASPTLNMAAIGVNGRWEIVQFTTASLVAGKTYTVSGFLRGRRGTEWACSQHVAGDQFVLLDAAQDEARGLSDVGTALSFKAITSGRTDGFPIEISSFAGNSLKPYAPCNLEAEKDAATDDWALSWTRRTRVGGAWTSGASIPLGETSEEYEVEILNGSTVVRTITGLTSASTTYTAAQQTTDFGAPVAVGALDWRVYQISASVDRGFAATGAH